jgi:hypothetical protein
MTRSHKLGFLAAALGIFTIAAAICSGATPTQSRTEPTWPTQEWRTSSPEEQGMDSKKLAELVDFGARRILATPGVTPSSMFDSLLVVRHGKIVVEVYYAPNAAGMPHAIYGCTQAVISTLIAITSKDGLLDSPSQLIMVFPDLGIVAVTTGRGNYSRSELVDYIAGSVKSDTSLPADVAGALLLANKILEVSTEKPTQVGATAKLAATISGKVYRFRPNEINVKSLSLILTGPQQRYDMETYARDATKSGLRFTGAIGLEGLYRKGERIDYGFDGRIGGFPRVNAVKGTWQDDHTFVIDRLVLGLAQSPEKWTLTFDGDKLNVRIKFGGQPEISIDGETGE